MMREMQSSHFLVLLMAFLLISSKMAPIQGLQPRKLDETAVPGSTDEKCTPCNPSPPPPSPPLCPPPPPPVLPPPAPKKPPSVNCPPPPSFIYITGPPGNMYPVDNDFGGAARVSMALPVLIGCGLLGFLIGIGF